MKHLFVIALLVVVIDRTWSECCTPSQWEGHQSLFGTSVQGRSKLHVTTYKSMLHYAYDADNELKAFTANISSNHFGSKIKVVYNYTEGLRYAIYPDVEACSVTQLESGFRKSCVPSDAELIEESYIGIKPTTIPIEIYQVFGSSSSVQTTVTDNCVPVEEVVVDTHAHGKVATDTYGFHGLTVGISVPNVFSVPDYCQEGASNERLEGLNVKFLSESRIFGI